MTGPTERIQFYGRRRGHKLRPGRRRLLDRLLPEVRIDLAAPLEPQKPQELVDPLALFSPAVDAAWLEIGFGGGEHLAAQAAAHPEIGLIGCEPFINGVGSLLARIEKQGLKNIRVHDDDARLLLKWLAPASFGRAFILFPDPWPKARHEKRRFVIRSNLDELARLLQDGAELRFATDDMGHARWALEQVTAHEDFCWPVRGPGDWRLPPEDWVATRYEEKARAQGRPCIYLRFFRRSRDRGGGGP